MKYYIRKTNKKKIIESLHTKIFPEDEFYNHKGNNYWLVTNDEGNYCGFCIATNIGYEMIFLSRVGVLKKYRGQGLHKRMIKVRENFAKSNGMTCLITYTSKDNYASFAHLIKMGYMLYDPDWDWVGPNVFYFQKELK